MDFFNELAHWFIEFTSIDIDSIRRLFVENRLESLWNLLRDLYLNPYYFAVIFPLWITVSYLWPVDRQKHMGSYVLDFLYPLLTLPIHVLVIVNGINILREFYEAYVPFMNVGLLDNKPIWIQTLGTFLVADFAFYVSHYLAHKVPWLWHFHAIHHSQRHINLFTEHRIHPFEDIFHAAVKIVPVSIVGGSAPSIAIYILIVTMWGYMVHANVRWNFGPLKYIFVSPQFHRMHHTIRKDQFDHNYGAKITLWDWLFGTVYKDFNDYPETGVKGLESLCEKNASPQEILKAWWRQMIYPFVRIFGDIRQFQYRLAGR